MTNSPSVVLTTACLFFISPGCSGVTKKLCRRRERTIAIVMTNENILLALAAFGCPLTGDQEIRRYILKACHADSLTELAYFESWQGAETATFSVRAPRNNGICGWPSSCFVPRHGCDYSES